MAEVRGTEQRSGPVDLTVPASSDHLRVLRLVATSLAASIGLDIDQLDDLRIATDELCSLLMEHATAEGRLRVTLQIEQESLVVEGQLLAEAPGLEMDPVRQLILDGLDIEWGCDAPTPCFRIVAPRAKGRDGS
jgi:anti-sigma regulatory factor (Ser/Thr protein kinase)